MAKPTSEPDSTIEGLLQQRAQYEQWLARLDAAGDKAPAAVRDRVRGDYETRLKGVIEQLRGHSTTISEELDRYRKTQSGLDREKRDVEEELSEAEVRHAVGEYSEDEWNRLARDNNDRLNRLRGELSGVGHEIARLAEVQGLISGSPKRSEPPPAVAVQAPPVPPAPEPEPEPEPEPVAPPVASARPAPSWVAGTGTMPGLVDEDEAPRTAAEQLDLAQAYLDVGDEEAARTLLREVIDGRDPAAREAAARLLREL